MAVRARPYASRILPSEPGNPSATSSPCVGVRDAGLLHAGPGGLAGLLGAAEEPDQVLLGLRRGGRAVICCWVLLVSLLISARHGVSASQTDAAQTRGA